MNDKKSRWQEPEAVQGRNESESLEWAMKSILRMFADGNLVYRRRETRLNVDVSKPSDRLRRIRAASQPSVPAPLATA
jgi:hypothetical protein